MASDPEATIEQLAAALEQARSELRSCRDALRRTQGALGAVGDGLAVLDLQGQITYLNPVAAHLTGWTETESLGRDLSEIVQFTDARGRAVDVLSAGFSNRHDDIVSLCRRDGHSILVDGTVAQIHDRSREPIGSVVTFRNVTAAARLSRELTFHANHDALTGLHNRRAFEARLQRAIVTAAQGCSHAVLYFDLDQFKDVNDSAGHVAGDELLRQLAILLRRHLREQDQLARLGGDEFAVLLENCTTSQAEKVAEKIRTAIAQFDFDWRGQVFRIGCSIGLVQFADDAAPAEEIVNIADRMCYAAKAEGRNRVVAYDDEQAAEQGGYRPPVHKSSPSAASRGG